MADFKELVKKFDKIRDFSRDFLVYGIRTRNTQNMMSKRSYDNEKRRIESYLGDYIAEENDLKGKRIQILINPETMTLNPLYDLWQTKSYTKNDIYLHFIMTQLNHPTSLHDVYDNLLEDRVMDMMTVRNKLNEYSQLGLLSKTKSGKTYLYQRKDRLMDSLTQDEKSSLGDGLAYFSNIMPFGFLGGQILNDFDDYYQMKFNHYFMFHTLDDLILLDIFKLIMSKQRAVFTMLSKSGEVVEKEGTPLLIMNNVKHGRRYVVVFDLKTDEFYSMRLDKIKYVKNLCVDKDFDSYKALLESLETDAWGVFINKSSTLETIEMVLKIDEVLEKHIFKRIHLEGKHGHLDKIDKDLFVYKINVIDTYEMLPWLRSFIGRIVELRGTNEKAIKQFKSDLKWLYEMYELGENDE